MRQRVFRGVERMRAFFASRGIDVSAPAVAEGIAVAAAVGAPAGLAEAAAVTALASASITATAGAGGSAALWKGTVIAMAKTNAAAVTVVAILLVAGTSGLLYALFGVKAPPARPKQEVVVGPAQPARADREVEPVGHARIIRRGRGDVQSRGRGFCRGPASPGRRISTPFGIERSPSSTASRSTRR